VGFLRIKDGKNPLDNTNIHPEVYPKVMELLEQEKIKIAKLQDGDYRKNKLTKALEAINRDECAESLEIGIPTLELILENLVKPALDPRDSLPKPLFRKGVMNIDNLHFGQTVTAVVRNVVDFGAFCDIGIKQDALLHKTEIPNCDDIFSMLQVGDIFQVTIKSIEKGRDRVGVSLRETSKEGERGSRDDKKQDTKRRDEREDKKDEERDKKARDGDNTAKRKSENGNEKPSKKYKKTKDK